MCKVMEEMAIEERLKEKNQTAIRMLEEGSVTLEYIAKISELPLKTVKALAKEHGKNPA